MAFEKDDGGGWSIAIPFNDRRPEYELVARLGPGREGGAGFGRPIQRL